MEQRKSSNIFLGIIGALIGGCIGGVVWYVVLQLGYVVSAVGALIAFLAIGGYALLGKSVDLKGCIISILVVIGVIYVCNDLTYAKELSKIEELGYSSALDAFKDVHKYVKLAGVQSEYNRGLVQALLYGLFGAVGLIVGKRKMAR